MDKEYIQIKEQLMQSIFRVKHLNSAFYSDADLQMAKCGISITEFALMKTIENNMLDSDENTGVSDIQKHLYVTKAAISKMLGVLEKKGYVNREVNRHNRRTLLIKLRRDLDEAVSYEEYERARVLRDKIKEIENE